MHPVACGLTPPAQVATRKVLAQWGVRPRQLRRLGGNRNAHWIVTTAEGQYVLRCYRPDRDRAAIEYEFAVLEYLSGKGWPVACPIGELRTWRGRTFAMFPRLTGRPRLDHDSAKRQRERGGLLAELHQDLATLDLGQRSRWQATDQFLLAEAERIVAGAQRRLSHVPLLRDILVTQTGLARTAVAEHTGHLPRSVVHGDFVGWNLLWRQGRLVGVIDFDDVRLDLRAADVACARRRRSDQVVAGYAAVSRLAEDEVALLDTLWRAYTLVFVADLLRARTLTAPVVAALEWCATQLTTTRPAQPW